MPLVHNKDSSWTVQDLATYVLGEQNLILQTYGEPIYKTNNWLVRMVWMDLLQIELGVCVVMETICH